MHKGKLALRLIFACGLGAYWMADWIGDHQPAPHWFASGLSEAALFAAITTAMLWIVLETWLHFVRHRGLWATGLAVACAGTAAPAFYLVSAARYAAEQADINTWHLVALFVIFHQIYAIVVTIGLAVALAVISWIARSAARCIEARRTQNS
jgi:hypothetical protein